MDFVQQPAETESLGSYSPLVREITVTGSSSDGRDGLETSYPHFGLYTRVRPVLDQAAGFVLFVIWLPVMAAAWAAVRLTSAGPGLYSQTRLGLNGRPFRIYKLRTMYHNCEATMGGIRWSGKGDRRVTPLGRVLRRLHVDELPQLWNVVIGDMSLVGPRPERPELVGPLAQQIPGYRGRLAVPPGLTGLAQIQLPPDTDVESVRIKLRYDLCYIRERTAWLDARLLAGTIVYLAGCSYANVRRLLALPSPNSTLNRPTATPDASPLVCGTAR